MALGAKLNLKDGMTLAVVAQPESVTLDLGVKVDRVEGPDEADAVAVLPYGVRPVRQVSVDATWSAVRLRPGPGRSR